MSKEYTPDSAAQDVEAALRLLEGRWKLVILFHLFGGKILRFSDLERAIPNITQKMLGQQLRRMESDGIVVRKAYPQVPPKVEYSLTTWRQSLCPALDAFLRWVDLRPQPSAEHLPELTVNTNASGRKDGREQRRSKH
jgi:DNA-binding HxlR family transcriptional regulator